MGGSSRRLNHSVDDLAAVGYVISQVLPAVTNDFLFHVLSARHLHMSLRADTTRQDIGCPRPFFLLSRVEGASCGRVVRRLSAWGQG